MHIQIESRNLNSIISYNESQLMINHIIYKDSLIISKHNIISPWPIHSLTELTENAILPMIQQNPEVILFGHSQLGEQLPLDIQLELSKQHIGFESMPIGAACRTFNVLLSESRNCVIGVILEKK